MTNTTEIYKITFLNKGKVYEIFVKQVYQSDLYGFIEMKFLFDERSQVVVDPSEEKLKSLPASGVASSRCRRSSG